MFKKGFFDTAYSSKEKGDGRKKSRVEQDKHVSTDILKNVCESIDADKANSSKRRERDLHLLRRESGI
jgi:hypothetical protein